MSLELFDTLVFDVASKVRKTKDGFLTAQPRVARTGIQIYRGSEVGKPELDRVRVYRPQSEVFSADSLKSYAHKTVTIGHPNEMVSAANWKQHAVGSIGDEVIRDGGFVRVPMTLMDADAVKAFEDGRAELSLGYICDLKFEDGVTNDGESYDAVQTNIRANHLAVVNSARGGSLLRIGDDSAFDAHLNQQKDIAEMDQCCGTDISHDAQTCSECGYNLTQDNESYDSFMERTGAPYLEPIPITEDEMAAVNAYVDRVFVEDNVIQIPVRSGNPNRDPDTGEFAAAEGGGGSKRKKRDFPPGYGLGGAAKGEQPGRYVRNMALNWRAGPIPGKTAEGRRSAINLAIAHARTLGAFPETQPEIRMGKQASGFARSTSGLSNAQPEIHPGTQLSGHGEHIGSPEHPGKAIGGAISELAQEAEIPGILRKLFSRKSKQSEGNLPEASFIHVPGAGKNAKGAIFKPNSPGFTSKAAAIAHLEQQRSIWKRARAVPADPTNIPIRGLKRLNPAHPIAGFRGYKEVKSTHFRIRFDELPLEDDILVEMLDEITIDFNPNHDPLTGEFANSSAIHTLAAKAAIEGAQIPSDRVIHSQEEAKAHIEFQKRQVVSQLEDLQRAQKLIVEQQKKWAKAKVRPVTTKETIHGAGFLGLIGKTHYKTHYTISHDSNSLVSDDLIEMVLIDEEGDPTMSVTLTIDSIPVETTEIGATVIRKELDKLAKLTSDSAASAATAAAAIAEKDKQLATKDAEIAVLTKKVADATLTPQQKDAAVRERYEVVNKAQAILGDQVVIDGKTDSEIRRQVVDSYMGANAKAFTDEHISAAFAVITKDAQVQPSSARSLADSIKFATPVMDERAKALAARDEYTRNAWKMMPAKTA